MRLIHKTALVTGGTTGLGFATARRLLDEGVARLVVTGQDAGRVEAAARALGPAVTGVRADVRDVGDLDRMAEEARAALGRLDLLFVNAGLGLFAPLEAATEAFWDEQFDVNVRGAFFTVQKLLPLMGAGGSVVLNASAVSGKGLAAGHAYLATKAAVRSLARSLAAELGPRGIRVNAVSPGLVPTEFMARMGMPPEAQAGFADMVTGVTPLGRVGRPEEVAAAVAFLLSDDAAFVAAADLLVDGGYASV